MSHGGCFVSLRVGFVGVSVMLVNVGWIGIGLLVLVWFLHGIDW